MTDFPAWADVLENFVAINTLVFAALAVGRLLPRLSVRVWRRRRQVAAMRSARGTRD